MTGDMILLEIQRIFERALALHAPIKACYIRKNKPTFLLKEKSLCEKKKKQRICNCETRNDLTCQKEKQLFSSFMELNGEKAKWNFIQGLRNKEKTQTRTQSLSNSFGNKIFKTMEIANLLNYRFFFWETSLACNKQATFPPKLLRESVSSSDISQSRNQMCSIIH